jgi:hypothetical protein
MYQEAPLDKLSLLSQAPNSCYLADQSKEEEIDGACGSYREKGNTYRVLVEKPEGKRQLGRPRRRRKDNVSTNLK